MNKVVLVSIDGFGSDVAVFLDGKYIVSADPGAGHDISQVEAVAAGLASCLGVDLIKLKHRPQNDEWQWSEVQAELRTKLENHHAFESPAGSLKISTGIPADDQLDSFQNATLSEALQGLSVSIGVYPKFPEGCVTEDDAKSYLENCLAPLCRHGWGIEVQIGPDLCDE